jgi:hypothetical protein
LGLHTAAEAIPHMSDESTLHSMARQAIRAGSMPARAAQRMWGGRGSGVRCSICGQPVAGEEVEYELQFAPDPDDPEPHTRHLHVRCLAAWEFERESLEGAAPLCGETQSAAANGSIVNGKQSLHHDKL